MSKDRFEDSGRSWTWLGLLLASACAGCGSSQEPAQAPRTQASAPPPSAPAQAAPEVAGSPAPSVAAGQPSPAPAPSVAAPAAPERQQPAPQQPAPAEASAPKPPQIELGELLLQRDLWPKKVALIQPLTIAPGVTLPIGHELSVYDFNGSDIALDDGQDIFECPATEFTDVIERASALKASLTSEQLALNDTNLVERPDLWPLKATVTRRLQFQNGKQIPVGREVTLRSVTIGWVSLYDSELADHFQAEIFETDVIARARERLALPEPEREPFFVRAVAAALEPSKAAGELDVAKTDYLLVYRARLGCPRCEAFAPELAGFYQRVKPEHPGFETVFYSEDKSAADARTMFANEKLPGRAIQFDQRFAAANLAEQTGELLPLVYLYDRTGNMVARNSPNGGQPSAADVLAVLEAKLQDSR